MSSKHHAAGARPVVSLGIPEFVVEGREPLRCRADPDAYFADGLRPAQARVLCAGCGYLDVCRAYALGRAQLWGVWGGTTRREREALRRGAGGRAPPLTVS
ncbi:WhiB family transcriptional regulator [Streptomyces mirabilis]